MPIPKRRDNTVASHSGIEVGVSSFTELIKVLQPLTKGQAAPIFNDPVAQNLPVSNFVFPCPCPIQVLRTKYWRVEMCSQVFKNLGMGDQARIGINGP